MKLDLSVTRNSTAHHISSDVIILPIGASMLYFSTKSSFWSFSTPEGEIELTLILFFA